MALLFLFILAITACTQKSSESKTDEARRWSKLDGFHTVMADAFHPYKDSGNLVPAKGLAQVLADSAEAWAGSPLPEKVNNDEMKEKVQKLFSESAKLLTMSKDGSVDSVFAAKLSLLHDVFHEIQESWYGAGKKEHKH